MPDVLEKEYARNIIALSRAGILAPLPRSGNPGVIGMDGKKYPVPTEEELRAIYAHNKGLVDRKRRQGFTRLQLTPLAMPVSQLVERAGSTLIEHATAVKVMQTKQGPSDTDMPARVSTGKAPWIWEKVRQILDTPGLVYFPQVYSDGEHQGATKEEVLQDKRFCAVSGWSVGFIELLPIMPRPGRGKTKGGRKQLEVYSTPREYLQALSMPAYRGETGWTPEDFLTHFTTQLVTTGQVSHARYDGNALWLLGAYVPDAGKRGLRNLVLVAYWDRGRMYMSAHRSGNHFRELGARTVVRLGA
jgi:hypothetical protein